VGHHVKQEDEIVLTEIIIAQGLKNFLLKMSKLSRHRAMTLTIKKLERRKRNISKKISQKMMRTTSRPQQH
jgi:hypothetical protein